MNYVLAAYLVTGAGLVAVTLFTILRLRYWAQRARELDKS